MASAEPEGVKPPPPAEPEAPAVLELEKAVQEAEAPAPEPQLEKEAPPETNAIATDGGPPKDYFQVIDVVLRVLLFVASLVAVVVLVTSKQTKVVLVPGIPIPNFRAPLSAKFNNSPALIYFVTALSVSGFYSIITTLLSIYALLKPDGSTKLVSHFVIFDVLLLGIVAAATGSAGAVGYIGYKGDSHARWQKVCDTFDVFCKHVASSIAFSLFGSVVLALLVLLSVYSLSKKIPK